MSRVLITGIFLAMVTGCGTGYKPVANLASMDVSFGDKTWDGVTVPKNQECRRDGGQGASPLLIVKNIPIGTNAILVEFNDASFHPLSTGGGHGAIWVKVSGENEITIPSVPSETSNIPAGVYSEHFHRGRMTSGAYLAPCSGGRGNSYFADVKAVYKAKDKSEESKLLGKSRIELGKY
jgi:hypothetical protein